MASFAPGEAAVAIACYLRTIVGYFSAVVSYFGTVACSSASAMPDPGPARFSLAWLTRARPGSVSPAWLGPGPV